MQQRCPQSTEPQRAAALRRCDGWLGQALALVESGGGVLPEAEAILTALGRGQRRVEVLRACAPLEKYKRAGPQHLHPALPPAQRRENRLRLR